MSTLRPFSALDIARDRSKYDLDAKPERWLAGPPFDTLDLRPGRVLLFGAPPGAGKTTFALQLVSDILDRYPPLRCVVGNVETAPPVLLDKLLARFASVPLDELMNRTLLDDERRRIDSATVSICSDWRWVCDQVDFPKARTWSVTYSSRSFPSS